jgi:hypothetical protein
MGSVTVSAHGKLRDSTEATQQDVICGNVRLSSAKEKKR